jgi:hypothetical protein
MLVGLIALPNAARDSGSSASEEPSQYLLGLAGPDRQVPWLLLRKAVE